MKLGTVAMTVKWFVERLDEGAKTMIFQHLRKDQFAAFRDQTTGRARCCRGRRYAKRHTGQFAIEDSNDEIGRNHNRRKCHDL